MGQGAPAGSAAGRLASGLSTQEAARRHDRDGPNVVPPPRRTPAWRLLLAQLTHFFAGMLWIASLLALLSGAASLAVAIATIVLLNGVFAFLQEHKADRAAAELTAMMPAGARVLRDGEAVAVAVADLVVGDLVLLEAGDRIAADLRLEDAHDLTVDESMLTGESVPLAREAGSDVYAGTFAVQGDADRHRDRDRDGHPPRRDRRPHRAGRAPVEPARRPAAPPRPRRGRHRRGRGSPARRGVGLVGDRGRGRPPAAGWASWSRSCPRGCCRR